jgi:hypothetical protein
MVAQHTNNPGPPPRSLSPEVEDQLARALRQRLSGKEPSIDPMLQDALRGAAREARERALMPEDLVLVFKRLDQRMDTRLAMDETLRVSLRTKIVRALLEAYYEPAD